MCWKREFPNFLRSPSFPKSLGFQQTLFCTEKMLQTCLCDPLHEVQVAQDCGLCAGRKISWFLKQLLTVPELPEHRRTQHWRGCPEPDQISPGLKTSLQHSFSTSSAKLSLGNLQGWEIQPLPAAASVLPSQVMQHQVIGWILSQIYFQV